MSALRCSHCGLMLEPGLERCPQCLRRHTAEQLALALFDLRGAFLACAWTLAAAAAGVAWAGRGWVEAQGLRASATLLLAGLVLVPLRFATSAYLRRARWGQVARALAMVWALAFVLAGAVSLAARLSSLPVAVMVGLIVFCGPFFVLPSVMEAHREGASRRGAALGGLARFGSVAAVLLTLMGATALTARRPQPRPVVVRDAARPDPLDLAHAPLERAWRTEPEGLRQLHLASEAEPFERSLFKLKAALLDALSELDQTPDAGPVVTLWVPERFASAAARAAIAKESDLLNEAFTRSKRRTARGEPVRVVIAFGELPSSADAGPAMEPTSALRQ